MGWETVPEVDNYLDYHKFGKVNADARTFKVAKQSAVNTGAAAVEIVAAVTGKKLWITKAVFVNKTAGEYPVIELTEDHGGTPVIKDTLVGEAEVATSLSEVSRDYDPPIPITSGKSIGFQLQSATGDVYGHIHYWEEN